MTILERLDQVFRSVFGDDSIEVSKTTTAGDIEGWDSLSHARLIAAVEQEFNVKFTEKELLQLRNVGDLISELARKRAVD